MDTVFFAKALAKALVLPPTGSLLVALAGLSLLRRSPRTGRVLMAAGLVSLLLLCMPVVARLLTLPFDRAPFQPGDAATAQAIVVIGGGTRRNAPEYGGDTMGRLTLERVRYSALVAKATQLPVLVSGGRLSGARQSEARLMSNALEHEYAVPVRWREGRSRNTHENAQYSAALLKRDGVTRVVLVAHAIDIPRAAAEFKAAGVDVVPAATGLPSPYVTSAWDWFPSIYALQDSRDALYELIANAVRLVNGP